MRFFLLSGRRRSGSGRRQAAWILVLFLFLILGVPYQPVAEVSQPAFHPFRKSVEFLASLGDRSTGTPGCVSAARYIREQLSQIGLDPVLSHRFTVPVRMDNGSFLFLQDREEPVPIHPLIGNAVSPETIAPEGLEGPLVYVGSGQLSEIKGKEIFGAILLMEMDSGRNWLQSASLGAKALIYIDRGETPRAFFEDKTELTPIRFPRFWIPAARAARLFGSFERAEEGKVQPRVRLTSDVRWQQVVTENVFCLIPGTDPVLSEECVIVDAFYDSTQRVFGLSPGADEACSVATLIELGRYLKEYPPGRSVLLVATGAHDQTLAGMREIVWTIRSKAKEFRNMKKDLQKNIQYRQEMLDALDGASGSGRMLSPLDKTIQSAIVDRVKTESDRISKELMRLRLEQQDKSDQAAIEELAEKRLILRRLSWRSPGESLTDQETAEIMRLIPLATDEHRAVVDDAEQQLKLLRSADKLRKLVKDLSVAVVVSLHLSSNGDGFGAFNQGWLYSLKPTINRVPVYTRLDETLKQAAFAFERSSEEISRYKDTLRPNRLNTLESYLVDRPLLGGEISALAGYLGVSLATVHDARARWGTPFDLPEKVNWDYAVKQSNEAVHLICHLSRQPLLADGDLPSIGFSTIRGKARFLRHGELFPDQPAPGSVILAYQGLRRYYAVVDATGFFHLKGLADKKHVLDKVIIEGYRFDPATGEVLWAIDKNQTGKSAYRVKMQRRSMESDLVMFTCRETTLFNLLEPRNFNYLTKIQLIDARLEAEPMRYWWSRIDTRMSNILSVYLEPATRFKLTLSDTVLQKKMLLTHAADDRPEGSGYRIDEWPAIYHTEFRAAGDMWRLLVPRIGNLERHGIFSDRIRLLQQEGTGALEDAAKALKLRAYDRFFDSARKSWALASRVYSHVEKTQRDVLFGVLFYVALFVPFAFCMERLLFSFSNIYKRIIAFSGILILLIAVIYNVHPAFKIAYSPMVVVLAFFILGLSLMVTLIIFSRFEEEMVLLQRRARHLRIEESSRWKAFAAAFFLGVSNLRRRRLRTFLTCSTLILLAFTIMSFTTVKTMRHHTRLLMQSSAAYQGFLFKNVNWRDMPREALETLATSFSKEAVTAPRVWLENEDRTRTTRIPVLFNGKMFEANGMIGLCAEELQLTEKKDLLLGGRWFAASERYAVILPDRMARELGIPPSNPSGNRVVIWGIPFEVVGVFSGSRFQNRLDLDGEPLSPVTFPHEISTELTEVEMEAVESGEDIRAFQSRYQHVPSELTVIVPHLTLLSFGGHLKSVAIRLPAEARIQDQARVLVDRFGFTLFSGEKDGTYIYKASDTLSYSGVPNVLIPLIISVCIVLNTMIGSVYERKREIGIYTSVGLAPSHVAFLFVAEALAFGVLSAVLGYLLAQTSAKLFSGTALWAGITVNYSSLAGVAAMFLVILVVLVSVIYPSRVAVQIAIPDVKRSWRLPESRGNLLEMTLPFLLKHQEQPSVAGYLFDYFSGHLDVSHGLFSTGDLRVDFICPLLSKTGGKPSACGRQDCDRESCIRIHANVWLAPFDFGIMQRVEVDLCHAVEDPGFYETRVRLRRESGEANAWRRINKAFLYALRKQLLVWRSLENGIKNEYKEILSSGSEPGGISKRFIHGDKP